MSERAERVEAIRERVDTAQERYAAGDMIGSLCRAFVNEDIPWLCAEIDRLREERERLREALRPFAEVAAYDEDMTGAIDFKLPNGIKYRIGSVHWRQARQALTDSEESEHE